MMRSAASAHSIPALSDHKEISPRTQAKQDAYAGVSRWGLLNDAPALNPNRQLLSGFLQAVRRQIREDVARGLVSAVADGETRTHSLDMFIARSAAGFGLPAG